MEQCALPMAHCCAARYNNMPGSFCAEETTAGNENRNDWVAWPESAPAKCQPAPRHPKATATDWLTSTIAPATVLPIVNAIACMKRRTHAHDINGSHGSPATRWNSRGTHTYRLGGQRVAPIVGGKSVNDRDGQCDVCQLARKRFANLACDNSIHVYGASWRAC